MVLVPMYDLPIDTIFEAHARIRRHVRHTPLLPLPALADDFSAALRLKLENLQVVGSFKPRGVFNTLLQLDLEARMRGVAAASGGNHGVALAYAAQRLGISATVYLPATASPDRIARVEAWGARAILHGRNWDDAHARAVDEAEATGQTYVHPFDAEATLAGQGTLGLEIVEDVPELDCALIAIGGGGLIGGVAAAIKRLRPSAVIIGVEPAGAPTMLRSLEAGVVRELAEVRTIADTLAPRAVSQRTLDLTRRYVDRIALVDDHALLDAMRWLWLNANQLVEPAGAAVIAALKTGVVDISAFRHPVAVICGGNASAEPVWQAYAQAAAVKQA
jgi:threonine dehydratase